MRDHVRRHCSARTCSLWERVWNGLLDGRARCQHDARMGHYTPGHARKRFKKKMPTDLLFTPVPHTNHLLSSFFASDTTSPLPHTLRLILVSPCHVHAAPCHLIQTLLPGILHTFASLYHHHFLRLEYMFPSRGSARRRTMLSGRNFEWFSMCLGQSNWLPQFCSAEILVCLFFLKERVVFRISGTDLFSLFLDLFSLFLQIWRVICLRPTHLVAVTSRLSNQLPFPPSTPHHSHLPPNHTLPPHTRTLPPVTQDLTPHLTPTHHTSIPGRQPHVRIFQDHAESTSFNLNSGGDGQ